MLKTKSLKKKIISACVLVASLLGVTPGTAEAEAEFSDQVIERLDQIQRELSKVRQELAVIKNAVTQIHRQQVAPPAEKENAYPKTANIELGPQEPFQGNKSASIAIVEYSEFQCPFCARFNSATFGEIKRQYVDSGKVMYVAREFPLDFHDQAKSASIFALCAGEQNQYWAVRDALFQGQRQLGEDLYSQIAYNSKLNRVTLDVCLKNAEVAAEIDQSVQLATSLGVSGTPTFFIGNVVEGKMTNAKRVVGAQPISVFRDILDSML